MLIQYFSIPHLTAIVFIGLWITASLLLPNRPWFEVRKIFMLLWCGLLSTEAFYYYFHWKYGTLWFQHSLPLWHCSIAFYAIVIALFTKQRRGFDIACFYGIVYVPIAIIFPVVENYPHPQYFILFAQKGLMIIALILLIRMGKMKIRRSFFSLITISQSITFLALWANMLLNEYGVRSNYHQLMYNPTQFNIPLKDWWSYFLLTELVSFFLYIGAFLVLWKLGVIHRGTAVDTKRFKRKIDVKIVAIVSLLGISVIAGGMIVGGRTGFSYRHTEKTEPLWRYVEDSLYSGAPGVRYWCGRMNDRNWYDCWSSMDQAAMINLYSELFILTGNSAYLEESLKFWLSWNSTCWPKTKEAICGEGKQQWEMIIAMLKLYALTENRAVGEWMQLYLSAPIESIRFYSTYDRAKLAQAYILAYALLWEKSWYDRFLLLKSEVGTTGTSWYFLNLLESTYGQSSIHDARWSQDAFEIGQTSWDDWYTLMDIMELARALWLNELSKNIGTALLPNSAEKWIPVGNRMMYGRKLLNSCGYPGYSPEEHKRILDFLTKNIDVLQITTDPGKHYSYAGEWDNFAPFFLGLSTLIQQPSQCSSWNIDIGNYKKHWGEGRNIPTFPALNLPERRQIYLLLSIEKYLGNEVQFVLYASNNTESYKRIRPVFDSKFLDTEKMISDIPNEISLLPRAGKEYRFKVQFNTPQEHSIINKNTSATGGWFYWLYFIDDEDRPYYLDFLTYPQILER